MLVLLLVIEGTKLKGIDYDHERENSDHMNRRLPAIALAIAALDLRRRVPDPKPLP